LGGFFWLTQLAITDMLRRGGGHVVNISATVAARADSAAPSVLTALTKGGLAAAAADSYAALGDRMPPLGRIGQISDVVEGILFLESAPYVTGEILHIDGGQVAGH
jgi:NAD(P)-dependent dehydrogenase (short-subunit alcohol dehydrogenase family)